MKQSLRSAQSITLNQRQSQQSGVIGSAHQLSFTAVWAYLRAGRLSAPTPTPTAPCSPPSTHRRISQRASDSRPIGFRLSWPRTPAGCFSLLAAFKPDDGPGCEMDGEGAHPLLLIKLNKKKPMMSFCMIVGASCDWTFACHRSSHFNRLPGTDGICTCREPTGQQTISLFAPQTKLRGEAMEWS